MAPAKPSTQSRDKQDLDYLIAILTCSDASIDHHWELVHRMTTAMGYKWSRKTVSNYWSERVAKSVEAARKLLPEELFHQAETDTAAEAGPGPATAARKRKRTTGTETVPAAEAVEAAEATPEPVVEAGPARKRKARTAVTVDPVATEAEVPAAPEAVVTRAKRNRRAPAPARKKLNKVGPGSLFPVNKTKASKTKAEPKVEYEKNVKLEPLVKEDDSE